MPVSGPKKAVLFLSVLAIALIISVVLTRGNHVPTTVVTTHAVRRDMKSWVSSNGKVEPIKPQIIQSKLTAFIDAVSVKEGQAVKPGQTLLTLDAKDLETQIAHMREQLVASEDESKTAASGGDPNALAELRNNLSKIDADITQLRRKKDALERLYAKQAATRDEVEEISSALVKAEADKRLFEQKISETKQRSDIQGQRARLRIEEAQDSIRSLEEKLRSAVVKTSGAGIIYSLPVRSGMYVHEGDVLAEIADLAHIQVRIFVDEPDLGSLKQGQPVEFTWDALPNHSWNGHVEVLPQTIVTRGSRSVGEVVCSVDDAKSELLPNTNVYARIRTAQRDSSLSLPRGAVRTEGKKHYVFVVDHGRVRKQEVDIGISSSTDYEVLGGVTEADTIALPGGTELHDGLTVNLS
jgi:HlyD family secretion protein